jgi:hypothetical protein
LERETISVVANVLTALSAFVGLLFIYRQLGALTAQEERQSRVLKLNHYSEYTKRYQEIMVHLPSNVGASQFVISKLKAAERERVLVYMRAYFDLCYEEWDLHESKLIELSSWKVWKDGIGKTMRKPAFREAWTYLTGADSEYGMGFTAFMAEMQA